MDLGLAGRVALVLASSKGLGYACAEALAGEGCAVAIVARDKATLEAARIRLAALTKAKVTAHAVDVGKTKGLGHLVKAVLSEHGRIDVLVTNSGGPPPGSVEGTKEAAWDDAYALLLKMVVRVVEFVAPGMKERKWGRIINIVSSSVREPIPGLALSNTFRPAVIGLAKTLSQELGPFGITVNNVAPGRLDTDRLKEVARARAKATGRSESDWMAEFGRQGALGRIGTPRELGDVVAFLASERARFVTGTTIPVDGGLLKGLW